ncbi:mitochondrial-processing peptidase subunit alpha [Brachypodium distachyon]|nr:mitochondrial-processing peptidase subunit alpha [Brachypodium distachyon]|eukprot:XP_003564704.1 mitochondrial-processing peptidase subunit alpha [Brachypodium distachyon]
MYRAASGLGALKRHGADAQMLNLAIRSASTSVAQRSSGGFWTWLTGARSNALPPPDFPLPGVTIPPPLPDHVEPGKTRVTTLPNGVKIASETSPGSTCSVGVYVNCGSVYEAPETLGATQLLKKLAFTTTTNRSHLRVVREIDAVGGKASASANREMMSYSYAALKTYMPEMVEVLVDSVRNPALLDWEVKEQIMKLKAELAEASSNPETFLLEALHSTGYSGALANPLIASESSISRLNTDVLEDFLAENYTSSRIVLAASGVDHDELVSIAEPLLSDIAKAASTIKPKSDYVGGEYRRTADSAKTDVALAFEIPGGWLREKDFVTVSVLQTLLGGGGVFSWGRSGKGLHSRLNRLVNEFDQIKSISAFKDVHSNTGIFGIHTSTEAAFVPKAIDLAARELTSLATPGQVDQTQLDRAKASAKSAILTSLESKASATEDMGRQVLAFADRKPVEHLLKVLDGVTLKDVSTFAEKIISSPLTMASHGNVLNVPTYDTVRGKFSSK